MKTLAAGLSLIISTTFVLSCFGTDAMSENVQSARSADDAGTGIQATTPLQEENPVNQLTAAQSPLAVDGNLDIGSAPVQVPFMVEYPSFGPGHKVILRMAGVNDYATPVQTTTTNTPITFVIPKATLAPNFGNTITVTYTVEVPGAPIQTSAPMIVHIMLEQPTAPVLTLAVDGKLDIGKTPLQVPFTVTYPSQSAAHRVVLNVEGTSTYKTAVQTTTNNSTPLTFQVPREVLARETGKPLSVFYTVEIAGVPVQTSARLELQPVVEALPAPELPLPQGVNVAIALNGRYANEAEKCDDGAPAYYCSGVMIRGTQNGNFAPWNPSAAAIALGGVSFSYIRKDAHVTDVYRNSGYIVSAQQEALGKNKALDYLCVYAFDAWTAQPERPDSGCGFQPKAAQVPDPSTCSGVRAQTEEGWYSFTSTLSRQQDQCSLSTQDADQFLTSLKVRANRPSNMPDAWNEVLVKAWDQDVPERLPLEAFFYKNNSGLAEARSYQQKYIASTKNWIPIIKLDLARPDSVPFSYSPTDQAIQP